MFIIIIIIIIAIIIIIKGKIMVYSHPTLACLAMKGNDEKVHDNLFLKIIVIVVVKTIFLCVHNTFLDSIHHHCDMLIVV